ncbi:peroxidase family protein [Terrabacter aeriphilus]|uniref:peroxidase family protein n=1 Tax=Terrabacter aeriphilus TaxID=515662 RepID=UPI0031E79B2F
MAAGVAFVVPIAMVIPTTATQAAVAPAGNGFVVTAGDLSFILKQIKIAERHSATWTASNLCGTLVGPGPDQVPDRLTSYGLRTVDGSCNNLFSGRETFAAADQPFPRLAAATFRDAEDSPVDFFGPGSGTVPSNGGYTQKLAGNVVFDSQPRTVSNLVVDQTSTNPAAIAAAGAPVRSQRNPGLFPCTVDPDPVNNVDASPAGCVPSHQTLFIPNVTTDVGLSPPYNSMFTFFGQFFDHGVDQTVKSSGTVFVPLKADDPLRTLGADGKANTGDEVPASQAFMVLTRAQNQPGPDGKVGTADDVTDATNTDSPWVDQSQTYTSHSSHQVFLREYTQVAGKPVPTGRLLGGLAAGQTYAGSPDGRDGISTWASTKKQAHDLLGLRLVDADVTNIPMLATDPYGNFLPGPNGLPQYVLKDGSTVEGHLDDPATAADETVPVPADVRYFDTPFLTDIAHNADPSPQDTDHNPATAPVAPIPDADNTPSADFAHQPAGTYDDEMLDAHFTCGDGRCNENIALSTIHQVFHSEHDRLVADITATLNKPENAALLADFQGAHPFNGADISFGFGGRLFQAARFVTEMEYQHLVFEEFGRKMVPAIRPFHVYSPDMNPAIDAEFAHAVYRFGHSMLDDDVARVSTRADGSKVDNHLKLLDAFLNPPAFYDNAVDPAHPVYTPQEAAGAIVMGSSDQVGNELDEFVTETLRNNLLGLPLDLASLNMTRARDAGVPRLNEFRRAVFADTNDGQLAPYTSWQDFGQHLKHPESLVNFVAAYGQHPSITSQTTLKGRRDAARAIVDARPVQAGPDNVLGTADDIPADVQPADAADFMFGNAAWADAAGRTTTGVDDVDLWVGGLAEVTNLFGGLLGSTFNYVFQTQMEKLQDGDRFYYLNRTPGMNLRTQLEGNSFSEMIQRNTDGTNTLKADVFATADCKFQLSALKGTAADYTALGSTVADDPATEDCNESLLLVRSPDGTIAYRQRNTVDVPGINGQAVYNGTSGVDRVKGGNDNDTFWGGPGNDVIDGQGGDDIALGGDGNDIITDLDGADVPKGGPGNDAIDAGPGDDIPMGNEGQDFINGGANDNETFAGPGNDFVIAGQGADAVFGDGGDDWIQGGSGQDLLQGDHGAPFFDDPAESAPGNDIFVGQVGENDYDAEGGDDVMAQNAAVDRNAGAGGFDWAIGQYNTVAQNDDMMVNNNLGGLPIQLVVNRDRWQEVEADSGTPFNDTIKGTDGVLATPRLIDGTTGGFTGCDAIDQAGMARIGGLSAILPPVAQWQGTSAAVAALSASGVCPLSGPVWGEGDILLGGGGNDTLEGRAGDEIIDGDRALTVRISVRTNPADPATEIGSTDLMENRAVSGNFGPGTTGMTLQQAVFAGLVDPGNLVAVRTISSSVTAPGDCGTTAPFTATPTSVNCDVVVFTGPRANYTITPVAASGSTAAGVVVSQTGANVVGQRLSDGTDTVRNVEALKFSDATVQVKVPAAPTVGTATASAAATATGSATVSWTGPVANGGPPVTGFEIVATPTSGTAPVVTRTGIARTALSGTVTGLVNGTAYTLQVRAVNLFGAGPLSAASNAVTPAGLPGTPTSVVAVRGNGTVDLSWTAPANGGSPITGWSVQVRVAGVVVRTDPLTGSTPSATIGGLANGTTYTFRVAARTAVGLGAYSTASNVVTPATVPDAPVLGAVTQGAVGGALTLAVAWTPPAVTGGNAITAYTVTAYNSSGTAVQTVVVGSTIRNRTFTFTTVGPFTFDVTATNGVGTGAASARSAPLNAR